MTYQETKWVVNEVERLCKDFGKGITWEYFEVFPSNFIPSMVKYVAIDEVKAYIDKYYGVYKQNDIIVDNVGMVGIIVGVESEKANNIHEIRYHIMYQGGLTDNLNVDRIKEKVGTYVGVVDLANEIIKQYDEKSTNNAK